MFRSQYDVEIAQFSRILIGLYFVYSGIANLTNLVSTASTLNIPGSILLLIIGAGIKITLGLCLALRYHVRYVTFSLAVYLIGTTVLLYGPQHWEAIEHFEALFFRNIAIVGGLLFIYASSRSAQTWHEEWIPENQQKLIQSAQRKIPPHP